jgi:hypothetical protein
MAAVKPFPSRGKGWDGVEARAVPFDHGDTGPFGVSDRLFNPSASTPIPGPSPLEGEGRVRYD